MSDLKRRISHAIEGQFAAPVTYTEVRLRPQAKSEGQAPWAQAEKLLVALTRFPRKSLVGLITSDVDILITMDVANDAILRNWNKKRFQSEIRSRSEVRALDRISDAEISSRDRCEAVLMLIDGRSPDDIYKFIAEKEEDQRS